MKGIRIPVFAFCIFILAQSTLAISLIDLLTQVKKNKKCEVAVADQQKDFSLKKFHGVWYISYQVNALLPADPPCQTFDVNVLSDASLNVQLNNRVLPGVIIQGKGNGSVVYDNQPAIMAWQWDFLPGVKDQMVVIKCDYDNYCVILACNTLGDIATGFVLSREENIPVEFLNKGKQILERYMDVSIGRSMKTVFCKLNPIEAEEKILGYENFNMGEVLAKLLSRK